ncbi:enoyl-CoA hydratase-related protein [Actinokineospora sp. 24-640]
MPELRQEGDVALLDLGDGENRFTPDWMTAVHEALDEVSARQAPRALVTVAQGKFWSNGLDVEWMTSHGDEAGDFLARVHALLARLLTFPAATAAAISGHAFGAGAMLAMAHDWRVMRDDRGYLCFPEADIRMPFARGMAALIQTKVSAAAARDSMLTARRFTGPAARDAGLVDDIAPAETLLTRAVELAQAQAGKDPGTLGLIKSTMYADAAAALLAEDQFPHSPTA